jgi:hypothetical protein
LKTWKTIRLLLKAIDVMMHQGYLLKFKTYVEEIFIVKTEKILYGFFLKSHENKIIAFVS